ncbi:MAG: hypothetical protein BA863_02950 [Desulfovibrio sp. S3730MH75]|nr:MAG: hypothetical protein BA863_02950 [Desulfovibrio sp. S3730MH75]
MISGRFAISNGPTYEYASDGQKVMVSAYSGKTLLGNAILDKNNKSAQIYMGNGPGEYSVSTNLNTESKTNTLDYTVVYFGQSGTTQIDGVLASWGLDD